MNDEPLTPSASKEQLDGEQSLLDQLADSFVQRLRSGDNPSVESYVCRYPELADEIKGLFPTLAMLEQCGVHENEPSGKVIHAEFPDHLAEYELIREIGRGGMGVVYEAEHATMRRRVALKILPRQFAEKESALKRFHREARAAGKLHHTNIVPVFEVGECSGIYFYAMQYIHGQNLDVVIDEMRQLKNRTDVIRIAGEKTLQRSSVNTIGKSVAISMVSGSFSKVIETKSGGSDENGIAEKEKQNNRIISDNKVYTSGVSGRRLSANRPVTQSQENNTTDKYPAHSAATQPLDDSSELSNIGAGKDDYFQRVGRVGLQVAEALEYAHNQRVMHRDIKPSNLILDVAGTVWVTDFGLAKNEGDNLTHTGDVVGTLRYMAPERFSGAADGRGDLYSLGLTLYELCTLRYAFDHHDRATLVKQLTNSEPVRPRKINPDIPRDLETIILKCIARNADDRYQTARTLIEDLERFLQDRPISARRTSWIEHGWRWCRRNPELSSLALCALVLFVSLIVGSLRYGVLQNQHAEAQIEHANELKEYSIELQEKIVKIQEAEEAAKNATDRLHGTLFQSLKDRARLGINSGAAGQYFDSINSIRQAAMLIPALKYDKAEEQNERLQLRNMAIRAMTLFDTKLVKKVGPEGARGDQIAINNQYTHYAQGDLHGNIAIKSIASDEQVYELPSPGERALLFKFSPDGNLLSVIYGSPASSRIFRVWELETQTTVIELQIRSSNGASSFASDSQSIAVATDSNEISVYETPSGNLQQKFDANGAVDEMSFRPGYNELAVARKNTPVVQVWNFDADENPLIDYEIENGEHATTAVNWSSDGRFIAIGNSVGELVIWDYDHCQIWHQLNGHVSLVSYLCFSNKGDILVSSSWDGTSRFWDVNRGVQVMESLLHRMTHTNFSADDRQLVLASDEERPGIWDLNDQSPLFTTAPPDNRRDRRDVTFHCQYEQLAVCGAHDHIEFWDVANQRKLMKLPTGKIKTAQLSPDGKWLIYSGDRGLFRRSIEVSAENKQALFLVGPEEKLLGGYRERAWINSTSSSIGVDGGIKDVVYAIDVAGEPTEFKFGRHPGLDYVRVSPDGRWVATSTWVGYGIRIWDKETRKLVNDISPQTSRSAVGFSPSGEFLAVVATDHISVFKTNTWEPVYTLQRPNNAGWPGTVSFSAGGELMMVNDKRFSKQIVKTDNGRTLAVFDLGITESCGASSLSQNGVWMGVAETNNVQFWNIIELQKRLSKLRLAFEQPIGKVQSQIVEKIDVKMAENQ